MTVNKPPAYIFSDTGLKILSGFACAETLFSFDLDGTLAPIVPEPSDITISREMRSRLLRLVMIASVAIITGRARADALMHLGPFPGIVIGNHGAEGLPGREEIEKRYVSLTLEWAAQLTISLPLGMRSGIVIENKGATLSLHYRKAPEPDSALQTILAAVHQLQPRPRLVAGMYVMNLVPPDAPNKGEALSAIMHHLGCRLAVFVGDDETDEDVFRLGNSNILGIRIGEAPLSSARYVLHAQDETVRLLDAIIEKLEAPRKHTPAPEGTDK